MDELLGGDIHYFGPIAFEGSLKDYDLNDNIQDIVQRSAKKQSENDAMNDALEMVGTK